ncbi:DUF2380 domain-containing protein [Streptomyces albiflavescens]|nr:DUF2380 domain-containing protein [Streptomyces albiflavescens]
MALPVLSQTARPLLPIYDAVSAFVETVSESEFVQTVGGGLKGEFNEDPTIGEITVDTVVSLIPVLDQLSDARDLTAHMYFMIGERQYDRPMRWVGLAFSLIGVIPEVGSAIKQGSKYLIHGAGAAAAKLNELIRLMKVVDPVLDGLKGIRGLLSRNWGRWTATALIKLQGWLAVAASVIRSAPQWLIKRRNEFLDAVAEIGKMAPVALREAFSRIKQKIDDTLDELIPHHDLALPGGGRLSGMDPAMPATTMRRSTTEEILASHAEDTGALHYTGKDSSGIRALGESGVAERTARAAYEYHHLLVQELRKWFSERGIKNIDDYTVRLSSDEHRWIHNEYHWNEIWKDFKKANPKASVKAIEAQLETMMKKYGIDGLEIVEYPW